MSVDAADEYRWQGDRVARWLERADRLDAQLAPVSDALFAAAGLVPGERVLDVGCGHGPTTRRAAALVGPEGRVTAVDVADGMIEAARERVPLQGSAPIDWIVADVAGWTSSQRHDVVLSRFGVMFFAEPVTAFASLAEATRAGGRLCVAVWGTRDVAAAFDVPYRAAAATLDRLGIAYDPPPVDGAAFSLGDPDRTRALVAAAGWTDVSWTAHEVDLRLGGGLPAEAAGAEALELGPARLIAPDDEAVRDAIVDAVTEAYRGHLDERGHVVLPARIGVVSATRP